jgi:UDP:flavonoid glycosyltransferase YjiC (YdhE family)
LGKISGGANKGMATILFAWELGGGLGHIIPMASLAEDLARAGHQVHMALRDLSRAVRVFGPAVRAFVQAPFKSAGPPTFRRTVNFGHILANSGWADDGELLALCSAWRHLFRYFRPDLIIFDHSPTALLAARGLQVRKIVTGPGFLCPPNVSPFPPLLQKQVILEGLVAHEGEILARANRLLSRAKVSSMTKLGQLYGEVADTMLTTFVELDPYQNRPAVRYWGPVNSPGGNQPKWPAGSGKRIYAYLAKAPCLPNLLNALQQLAQPTIVFGSGIDIAIQRRFESPTLHFENQRLDLAVVGRECDLAVLNGNHGTLCQMLLNGRPLLLVPTTLEQSLLTDAVRRIGAGEAVSVSASTEQDIFSKLNLLVTDRRYSASSAAFAERYADFDPHAQREQMLSHVTGILSRPVEEPMPRPHVDVIDLFKLDTVGGQPS